MKTTGDKPLSVEQWALWIEAMCDDAGDDLEDVQGMTADLIDKARRRGAIDTTTANALRTIYGLPVIVLH